ncbi:MAG: DNA repair protein RecO [Corynebacterium camporealensis]|uniref:DNA repair protein RecO n=1 Tax=Corynebacterium camporealensis TaxID=161896 RepID=UPI002A90CD17|nr:DNA repair protein RecO [Corynebacterium camporealensis]MDY5840957.1 DNA repair protein RecO [Corynebacterium camporealensis]
MRRENFRDRAVVIRSYDFGEADRVIVLLTKRHGLVRGVAKGVRRAKSRFGSRLQLFVNLDVQLYAGRSLYSITQADTVAYYGAQIIDDYERYTAACAALEAAERLAQNDAPGDPYLYNAITQTLERLQHAEPIDALNAFLLQAMAHAGWSPSLFDCAQCQRPGPHHAFHPAVGGAACHQCRPPGAAEVDPETLHHMWLLAHGYESNPTNAQRQEAHRLTRAYLQWHLERKVSALGVMEQ